MCLLSFDCLKENTSIIVDSKIYSLLNSQLSTVGRRNPLSQYRIYRQKLPNIIFGFFSSTEYRKRHCNRPNSRVFRIRFPGLLPTVVLFPSGFCNFGVHLHYVRVLLIIHPQNEISRIFKTPLPARLHSFFIPNVQIKVNLEYIFSPPPCPADNSQLVNGKW